MTTRRDAEALLFDRPAELELTVQSEQLDKLEGRDTPPRRRIDATYCPVCASWVEIRLQPIRLHCTGCGIEARP